MKKLFSIILIAIILLIVAGCEDEPNPVDVTLSSTLESATLSYTPNTPVEGDEVTIQASESQTHRFLHWIDMETDEPVAKTISFSFTIEDDIEYEAVYEPLDSVNLTLESPLEGAQLSASQSSLLEGDEVTIEASSVDGYTFSHWARNGVEVSAARAFVLTVNEDMTLTAIYNKEAPDTVTIDLTSETENARISLTPNDGVFNGDDVTIEADDTDMHEFSHWLDVEKNEVLTYSSSYTFEASDDVRYEAVYQKKPLQVRTLQFENLANEYDVNNSSINVYYYEDGVPYVNVESFLSMVDGAILKDELEVTKSHDSLALEYGATSTDGLEDSRETNMATMFIDTVSDRVVVNDFDFFNGLSADTKTNYSENLEMVDFTESDRDEIVIDLGDYGFDVITFKNETRMQLHLANLFFSGSMFDTYYNGDKIYGIDTYQFMENDSELEETLNDSSLNNTPIPQPLKVATDGFIELLFDYFYGLKEVKGVQSYINAFEGYENDLLGSNYDHYRATWDIPFAQDDLHTATLLSGFYEDDLEFTYSPSRYGPRSKSYYTLLNEPESRMYCSSNEGVQFMDNDRIAKFGINTFDDTTLDHMAEQMASIDAKGTVEDVVLDLSCNNGGSLGIMIQTLGYLSDDLIEFHHKNITDNSTSTTTYQVDIDAQDYEWTLLSSKMSYSAANAMLSIAKDMNVATIIGEDSTGGASSIKAGFLPSGSGLVLSSPGVITNDRFHSIEYGISPDIFMPFSSFDNEDDIIDILN